jgi:hypothetical protein
MSDAMSVRGTTRPRRARSRTSVYGGEAASSSAIEGKCDIAGLDPPKRAGRFGRGRKCGLPYAEMGEFMAALVEQVGASARANSPSRRRRARVRHSARSGVRSTLTAGVDDSSQADEGRQRAPRAIELPRRRDPREHEGARRPGHFPGARRGRPLSNTAFLMLLRPATAADANLCQVRPPPNVFEGLESAPSEHDLEPDFVIGNAGSDVIGGCGNDQRFAPARTVFGLARVNSPCFRAATRTATPSNARCTRRGSTS